MAQKPHFLQPLLRPAARLALYVAGTAEPVAPSLEAAFDSATRKRGLLGRTSLPPSQALVIAPCNLVHTFGMQFDIDIIFAARDGRIVKLRARLPPRRISGTPGAFAVIEMAAGAIARHALSVGQTLEVR
jgi:uncharacterized membrane protein (UPF0127 family)